MTEEVDLPHKVKELVISTKELQQFKHLYYFNKDGKYNTSEQVPHLAKIADGYIQRYSKTGAWTDILKAHSLLNSILVREPTRSSWLDKIFYVQKLFWRDRVSITHTKQQSINNEILTRLTKVRDICRESADGIASRLTKFTSSKTRNDDYIPYEFFSSAKNASIDCTNKMLAIAKLVVEKAVGNMTEQPPCGFAAIAIGSMAKGEATPYSDLEFMFLVETKSPEILEYFEVLAMTVYFFIGNLGETKLSYMAIAELEGWFTDTCTNGFKIDGLSKGAGNIPTGNGSTNVPNHFILTVDELIVKYDQTLNDPDVQEGKRGDFTAMMTYTKQFYRYGSVQVDSLLKSFKIYQDNSVQNQARQDINKLMFEEDISKYRFKPDQTVAQNGYVVDSKKDLYRYPSIMLLDTAILTETRGDNSWNTLKLLRENDIISVSACQSLGFLLACACYFRISAYLHHGSHDDRMSILLEKDNTVIPEGKSDFASKRWFIPLGIFYEYCEHLIAMKNHFSACKNGNIRSLLRSKLEAKTWHSKFLTLHFCHRLSDAWKTLVEVFSEETLLKHPDVVIEEMRRMQLGMDELWQSVRGVVYTLHKMREYNASFQYLLIVKSLVEHMPVTDSQRSLLLTATLDEISNCYIFQHEAKKAECGYLQSWQIKRDVLNSNDIRVGESCYLLGRCLRVQKDLEVSKCYLLKALSIFHYHASRETFYDYYGDEICKTQPMDVDFSSLTTDKALECLNFPSVPLAYALRNLAIVYYFLNYHEAASEYLMKALDFYRKMYGKAVHQDIANCFFDMANSCTAYGMHSIADYYFCQSVEMLVKIFSISRASVYGAIGEPIGISSHTHLISEKRCMMIMDTFLNLPGYKVAHPESANISRRYGEHLMNMGFHTLASTALDHSLAMYKEIFGENPVCSDIHITNSLIGRNLWLQGEKEQGIQLCEIAIECMEDIGDDVSSFYAAHTRQHIVQMGVLDQQPIKAKMYLTKASETYQTRCSDTNHPRLIEITKQLHNLSHNA